MKENIELQNISTEEKIKLAATTIFTQKGYAATKTRDIAEMAGINIASLHYYYRSKEKLFSIVVGEAMQQFSSILNDIFLSDISLDLKIKRFVTEYTDLLKENLYLPLFIFNESEKSTGIIYKMVQFEKSNEVTKLQLKTLIETKKIRPISFDNFIANLTGLTFSPFLNRHMMKQISGITDKEFLKMLEERKTSIPKMIINHLYFIPPE